MMARNLSRGSALPETAIVMTATLAMIFGIIQIGVIGFLQIMVDGAAFIAAHEYALGNANYKTFAQRVFPQVGAQGNLFVDQNYPDATTVAVNYNTNNTTQRHGGVSLIRATHAQVTAKQSAPTGLLGIGIAGLSNVTVHGAAIEPQAQVSNTVYDANGQGYTGNTATQGTFFPTSAAVNGDPQNAPANFLSQHYMSVCTTAFVSPTCNAVAYHTLGTAEFLDHDNWQRTNLGVGPYAGKYTFSEMLCHQQKFAQAAQTVFVPVTRSQDMPIVDSTNQTTVVGQIYSWDYVGPGGYGVGETVYNLYPLHPGNYC